MCPVNCNHALLEHLIHFQTWLPLGTWFHKCHGVCGCWLVMSCTAIQEQNLPLANSTERKDYVENKGSEEAHRRQEARWGGICTAVT